MLDTFRGGNPFAKSLRLIRGWRSCFFPWLPQSRTPKSTSGEQLAKSLAITI
jgi:hypothetical protein